MRVATEEEDILLQNISKLETSNYNLLNEIMLCESQIKGYKERRRQETVKFYTVVFVCVFLLIALGAALIVGGLNKFTAAVLMSAGGFGIIVPVFVIYTIIVVVRYIAAVSQSDTWIILAEKMNVENLCSAELFNSGNLIKFKKEIRENKEKLEEYVKEYDDLKKKNDEIFEKEVKEGKRKADFNFDAYNNYIDISNERITLNKLRVEYTQLCNRKKDIEESVENMFFNEDQCKKSIILFSLMLALLIVTMFVLLFLTIFSSDKMTVIFARVATSLALMGSGASFIINLVNFIFKLPYLADNKLAEYIADKLGIDNTKHNRVKLMDELSATDKRISEITEEMKPLKEIIDKHKDDEVYYQSW